MAAGFDAGFDDLGAVLRERPDGVADDFGTGEELGQGVDAVAHGDDLVVGRLDARDVPVHRALHAFSVATCGDEGNVVFAQVLADETPGVA